MISFKKWPILFVIMLFSSQQLIAETSDIILEDIGWSISYGTILGNYKIINNMNQKIIIKKIFVYRNNTHAVEPNLNWQEDSLILEPYQEKNFSYISNMIGMYYDTEISYNNFFFSFNNDFYEYMKPSIKMVIYYLFESDHKLKYSDAKLTLQIRNLIDYPDSLDRVIVKYLEKNCDSANSTLIEKRICKKLEFEKQDSIYRMELKNTMRKLKLLNDTLDLEKIEIENTIWEDYRYNYCYNDITNKSSSEQMIKFYKCETELTIKRREDIKKTFKN